MAFRGSIISNFSMKSSLLADSTSRSGRATTDFPEPDSARLLTKRSGIYIAPPMQRKDSVHKRRDALSVLSRRSSMDRKGHENALKARRDARIKEIFDDLGQQLKEKH